MLHQYEHMIIQCSCDMIIHVVCNINQQSICFHSYENRNKSTDNWKRQYQ